MMSTQTHDCPAELREALRGPVPSVRTPFTADGEIDFEGLRSQVEFLIAGRAKTLMLTWGDSLLSILTDDEVAELAKVVVEQTKGRAAVIAADNGWPTRKAVDFGEYCADLGADFLMLLPPDWGASTTPRTLVDHFNAVGQQMPTMLVTAFFNQSGVFGARPANFSQQVIRGLYEHCPNNVAIKDDVLGDLGMEICTTTRDRWAIVAGGWMMNHMRLMPYGVDGYLCMFMSIKPEIAWRYWHAVQASDWSSASLIIREVEMPLRHHIMSFEGGFNTAVHGMLELYGICPRHIRPPYHTATDEQMVKLKQFLKGREIL